MLLLHVKAVVLLLLMLNLRLYFGDELIGDESLIVAHLLLRRSVRIRARIAVVRVHIAVVRRVTVRIGAGEEALAQIRVEIGQRGLVLVGVRGHSIVIVVCH